MTTNENPVGQEKAPNPAAQPPGENQNALSKLERSLADGILTKITQFTAAGVLKLPKDYSAANALKFAWLMLQQTADKNKKPVLEVCSRESVANALLEMSIQGLNPMKKQCYFIAYGTSLTMQRSYQGSIAVAKRVSPVKSVHAQVIYDADKFEYAIDQETGLKTVTKHEQKMENIDMNKIKGAYAIVVFNDGSRDMEVMSIVQIRKAWQQGAGDGVTGAHNNFTDEMCRKTVINRICKHVINNSDDAALFKDDSEDPDKMMDTVETTVIEDIKTKANLKEVNLDEVAPAQPEAHAPTLAAEEEQEEEETEQLPEDVTNNIIIRLSECKNANQVKTVADYYEEYKENPNFQVLIANAKAKFATGEKKVKEKAATENPW